MARTNAAAVKLVLLQDYDTVNLPSLTPFIDTANLVVSRVETLASDLGHALTSAELEMIERWLAAHYYCQSDKQLTSKSAGGASGSFAGQTGMSLNSTTYGQTAINIDTSGALQALSQRQNATMFWLGLKPSEQTSIDLRS